MSALVDQWENVTDAMSQRLVEAWDAMSERIGDRPLWNEKQPEREQARQYQLVRNDPQAWASLMHEHGYVRTVEYMLRGERLSKKYPEEVEYGQMASEGAGLLSAGQGVAAAGAPATPAAPPTTPTLGEERHLLPQGRATNFSEGQVGAMNGRA